MIKDKYVTDQNYLFDFGTQDAHGQTEYNNCITQPAYLYYIRIIPSQSSTYFDLYRPIFPFLYYFIAWISCQFLKIFNRMR